MKRYQIITYSRDSGVDEKLEYKTLSEAKEAARPYRNDSYYEGVIIYDLKKWKIVAEYGYFPDGARPIERVG